MSTRHIRAIAKLYSACLAYRGFPDHLPRGTTRAPVPLGMPSYPVDMQPLMPSVPRALHGNPKRTKDFRVLHWSCLSCLYWCSSAWPGCSAYVERTPSVRCTFGQGPAVLRRVSEGSIRARLGYPKHYFARHSLCNYYIQRT